MLTIEVLPECRAAIDAVPMSEPLHFLVNDFGRPFASAAAFGNKFADWCREAGLATVECADGKVRSYRAHGLRKASPVALAYADATAPQLMAISGHSSLAQVQVYIDEANQKRLAKAAIDKLRSSREKKRQQTYTPN